MSHFAVTAIGRDRPGIVAALTNALFEAGCNLEDASSTVLRGSFAITLIVESPPEMDRADLQASLERSMNALGVSVSMLEVEAAAPQPGGDSYSLVVYGSDRPGIVARIAGLLSERGVNITDLSCRLTGDGNPVYAMVAELALPAGVEPGRLGEDLAEAARELEVDLTFRRVEADTL